MPATVLRLLSAAAHETPDAELLGQFLGHRDEAAFAELLRRHGPIVWRVCRRLVGASSADDAFQATFLVLACRAESVRKAASVGSWLVGVAGRVARQMRKRDRRAVAVSPVLFVEPTNANSPEHLELTAILDDELTRLPDHLRDPVVLCLLQGHTQQQAATELGGSVRTIRRRLDRAKALLRLRLERRGVVPAIVAGLIAGAGSPVMGAPQAVVRRTVQGAFDLAEGTVYPALHRLEGLGWVRSRWTIVDQRRRRVYQLTATGAACLADERTRWQQFAGAVQAVLATQ